MKVKKKMSFSQFSFGEPESASQVERKRKYPLQCIEENIVSSNDEDECVTCMMCNSALTFLSLQERSAHVNRCLDLKCAGIKKPFKIKKSPVREKYTDDNDIASIFSPNSSSLIAASSSSRNTKLKRVIDTKKKFINITKLPTNCKKLVLVGIDEKRQSLGGATQMPYEKNDLDLEKLTDSFTSGITIPKRGKIASFSTQKSLESMLMVERTILSPSSVKANANLEMNMNRNMTEDELVLFNLRLQLGKHALDNTCSYYFDTCKASATFLTPCSVTILSLICFVYPFFSSLFLVLSFSLSYLLIILFHFNFFIRRGIFCERS